ncbi:hypothetical protein GCM10022381_17470 [Leifsonia kafniensis]|uniref:LPXTG cell wall anchor domain-containing protein n=1 Tax=Leifsonia kafniensis TaxID=475957 RepID=A0ABP7KEV3_9MICO
MLTLTTPSARPAARIRQRLARLAAVLTASMLIGAGSLAFAAPAHAAPVSDTIAGLTFAADDTAVGTGATVTGYTPGPLDVTIPASVTLGGQLYAVTGIGDEAFLGTGLTSVVIPDSVVRIGSSAFLDNELTTLTIPDSVIAIGDAAFFKNQLTDVSLGDSVVTIGETAFTMNLLTTLTIPDSVTTIGHQAFLLNLLTTVTFGNSVDSIANDAFAGNFDYITGGAPPLGYTQANSTLKSVIFTGAAPTTFFAAGTSIDGIDSGSFGPSWGVVVTYPHAFDADEIAGGFTSPEWYGYPTQAVATVNFELNGFGEAIPAQSILVGEPATEPSVPTSAGHTFTGWYTDADATTTFSFGTAITADTTLYAGWEENAVVTPPTAEPSPTPTPPTETPTPSDVKPKPAETLAATGTANPIIPLLAGCAALLLGGFLIARRRIHSTIHST